LFDIASGNFEGPLFKPKTAAGVINAGGCLVVRKYYQLTNHGKRLLVKKQSEWKAYTKAVSRIMDGGLSCVFA
jgi:hypothetical protein